MGKLTNASVEWLVTAYGDAAAEHGRQMAASSSRGANVAHDKIVRICRELRRRGRDSQLALLPLLTHADPSVRVWSASHALEFAPEQAERTLEAEASAPGSPVAHDAELVLGQWREGTFGFP